MPQSWAILVHSVLSGSRRDPAPGPAAAFLGTRSTDPPPLIMSPPSDTDAYSYAKFLVDIYPDDAIEILCKRGSSDIIELVVQQVDRNCIRLGGGSRNKIKGMVEDRRWDDLKALRGSPTQSPTTTPRHNRRSGQGPPTPSSTASGSPQSQRNPSCDWIIVYGMEEPIWFTASPSGSEEYLIGEDKLERFQGLPVKWARPSKKIALGGNMIDVSKHIQFTWNRPGDKGTYYKQFWVVRPELIRHADVLLGSRRPPSRDGQGKAINSLLSLEHGQVPPAAPSPPQLGVYQASSTTSIRSNHNSSNYTSSRLPLRTAGRTATMNSGPPPLNNPPPTQPAASIMERESSRPGSASSTRTTKSSKQDTVLVQLSFEGRGNRLLALDLTKNGDEIIPYLEPDIIKLSGKPLDRSIQEIKIFPLKETDLEGPSSSLGEEVFEYIWDGMVEFMRKHRTAKKPEFRLDIG
ncbi:hypothetical protein N431DRAFT_443418 [Stipitochalara longipes BDJ]|nr:hypothetical protein N431DRAFT_443418 [Stipitochalara longipes BDJ]